MLLLKEDGSRKHYRYFWVAAVSRELHWAQSEKPGASGKVERLQSQRTSHLFCLARYPSTVCAVASIVSMVWRVDFRRGGVGDDVPDQRGEAPRPDADDPHRAHRGAPLLLNT